MNLVCRACLSTESAMVPLDESFMNCYNLLTNLNVSSEDGRPQQCCRDCAQAVQFCAEFRQKCITSESTLKQLKIEKTEYEESNLATNGAQIASDAMKMEVKNEINDDSTFEYTYEDFVEVPEDDDHLNFVLKTGQDGKPKKTRAKRKKAGVGRKTAPPEEPEVLSCGLCPSRVESAGELVSHLERHREGDGFCATCGLMFPSWPSLLAHRLRHGAEGRCHLCRKRLRCYVALEHHYLMEHYEGEKPSRLSCQLCPRSYETPRKMKRHIQSAHSEKLYICDHCSKKFRNKTILRSHLKSHYDEKAFACDQCDFSCKYSGGLKEHRARRHSPLSSRCALCRRVFYDEAQRERHDCARRERLCPVCGDHLAPTAKWSEHMARHSAEARFRCNLCEASFRTRGALKVHRDRHEGRRSKHCEFCPRSFYSGSVLIKHRRTHTGEKPYVCSECGKGFTGNHNLKVHMRVHGQNLVVKRPATNKPPQTI